MRLLKRNASGIFSLTKDLDEPDLPLYTILSHTWGSDEEEVSFDDITNGRGNDKIGFQKIEFCARQTELDGLEYFWLDTCCINKANYAELSEALVSMFRWYSKAERAYVFLSDVPKHDPWINCGLSAPEPRQSMIWLEDDFRASRWFTRGWTLQELLAPHTLCFFSKSGQLLGSRQQLASMIADMTEIPISALCGSPVDGYTYTSRIAWSYGRQTRKPEDLVYCLLGLLDVSIPVLYGERLHRAQIRLDRELEMELGIRLGAFPNYMLSKAVEQSDIRAIEMALMRGADVDLALDDIHGMTPLATAALTGNEAIVDLLLSNGADVNKRIEGDNLAPIHLATIVDWKRAVITLLDHNGDVELEGSKTAITALQCAVYCGHEDIVEVLLMSGVEINTTCLLHLASLMGHTSVVKILLAHGVDSNGQGHFGDTPLHWAAAGGHKDIVEVLLAADADINARTITNYTPLGLASTLGSEDMVNYLVAAGARGYKRNWRLALGMAHRKGHIHIVNLLEGQESLLKYDQQNPRRREVLTRVKPSSDPRTK